MKPNTRNLIVLSLAVAYITYAVYCFSTTLNWRFTLFYVLTLPYPLFFFVYTIEATKQRKYGRTIFYFVSLLAFCIASGTIMERLSTPDGGAEWTRLVFSKFFGGTASEYMLKVAIYLPLGMLLGYLIYRYRLQNKKPV